MRHAVFGASSLLGAHLVGRLHAMGEEVLAYDETPFKPHTTVNPTPVPIHRIDLERDLLDPQRFFGIESIDVGYWTIRSPEFRALPAGAGRLFGINAAGPVRAAEAVASAGARVFVHVSSASLYRASWEPISELGEYQRTNPYAVSAIAAEGGLHVFHAAHPRMSMLCLRVFGLFGPGRARGLVPGLIRRVREGEAVAVVGGRDGGDAEGLRLSLTYAEDACLAIERLVTLAFAGRLTEVVLNVASAGVVTVRSLAEAIGREVGAVARYQTPPEPRPGDLTADLTRLSRCIEIPSLRLEEAIRRTIAGNHLQGHDRGAVDERGLAARESVP